MFKKRNFLLLTIGLLGSLLTFSVAFGLPYYPSETLDPTCAPGAASCFVRLIDPKDEGTALLTGATDAVRFFDFTGAGVTASYVSGTKTLSINVPGELTTATNGLTLSGRDIKLGGTLTQNTTVSQAGFDTVFTGGVFESLFSSGGVDTGIRNSSNLIRLSALDSGSNALSESKITTGSFALNSYADSSIPGTDRTEVLGNPLSYDVHVRAAGVNSPFAGSAYTATSITHEVFDFTNLGSSVVNQTGTGYSVSMPFNKARLALTGGGFTASSFLLENSNSSTLAARLKGDDFNNFDIEASGTIRIANITGSLGNMFLYSENFVNIGSVNSNLEFSPNTFYVQADTTTVDGNALGGTALKLQTNGADGNLHIVTNGTTADLILETQSGGEFRLKSPTVTGATASVGQFLTLANATTGRSDFATGILWDDANNYLGIQNNTPGYALHVGSSSLSSGTTVARFENAGGTCDVTPNVSGGITCTSDIRFKKNITDMQNDEVRDALRNLVIKSYNMTADADADQKQIGFIAQNVQDLFPSLVRTDSTGRLSVSYAGMAPIIVSAVQSIDKDVDTVLNIDTKQDSKFRTSMTNWFKDSLNGIKDFVAENIFAKKVKTDMLCIGETCVTENELKEIIGQKANNTSSTNTTTENTDTNQSSSTTTNEEGSTTITTDTSTDTSFTEGATANTTESSN